MPLAERDDAMEALLFDRPDEPLGIGVELVGGSRSGPTSPLVRISLTTRVSRGSRS